MCVDLRHTFCIGYKLLNTGLNAVFAANGLLQLALCEDSIFAARLFAERIYHPLSGQLSDGGSHLYLVYIHITRRIIIGSRMCNNRNIRVLRFPDHALQRFRVDRPDYNNIHSL